MRFCTRAFVPALALLSAAVPVGAIPVLQIYIDGAIYDQQTETWVTSRPDFDLWFVGDVDAKGLIYDVKLTASFFGLSGTMTLVPATTTLIVDPSAPPVPTVAQTGTGGHPVLPDHGIFNDVTLHHWVDYAVGDMTLTDSPIGDYNGSPAWPTSFPDNGQVNVYRVHVEGWTKVHFDGYGTTVSTQDGRETTWKTPFSHDGQIPVQPTAWGAVKELYRR